MTAAAADVADVVVAGRHVVEGGRHSLIDAVPARLAATIEDVWRAA
jgi:hypothetical protein